MTTIYSAGSLNDKAVAPTRTKTRIRQMSPSDYVTAKKFIDGLAQAYESQLARQSDALGVR
jgi:hypothetical protein